MKNLNQNLVIKALLFLLLIISLSFPVNAQEKMNLINYFYYNGKPHYLKIQYNEIFISAKENITLADIQGLVVKYPELSSDKNFSYPDKMKFININRNLSLEELVILIKKLQSEYCLKHISPVFNESGTGLKYAALNEIIVQFKPNMILSEIQNFIKSNNLKIKSEIDLKGGKTYLLTIIENKSSLEKANEIYLSGKVNYSEPNFQITNALLSDPNDPQFPMQWALRNTGSNIPGGVIGIPGCDMRVDSAWMITTGLSQIITSIVDTGCDTTQEDLAANFIPGSGYNFITNTPGGMGTMRHGTNCAGIVSAVINNNILIAGVAPNCKMIPVICGDTNGIPLSAQINSIIYSYQYGAWIINNSWQAGASSALDNAINDAATYGRNGKGTVVMFASGNGNSAIGGLQSYHQKIITVGGVSPCNQRKSPTSCDNETTWGASYGPNLHIVAPCVKIYTTNLFGGLWTFAGTSSACPNAAGVAALVLSIDSSLSWKNLRERLCNSADKVGNYLYNGAGPDSLWGWNNEMGYGKVNAYNAVRYAIQKRVFQHTPLKYTEQITGNYIINCTVTPFNTPIIQSEIKLLWSFNNASVTDSVIMTNAGGNNYTAYLPSNGAGLYRYYLKAKDIGNNYYRAPYTAPFILYEFWAKPDTIKPTIVHTPRQNIIKPFWPDTIKTIVKDNYGVDSVWVKWKINSNGVIKNFKLNKTNDSIYISTFNSTQNEILLNDTIYYRIFAKDISISGNKDSTSLYNFLILSQYPVIIGNGTVGSYYPLATNLTDCRTNLLYKNSEIKSKGGTKAYITKAGFKVKQVSPCTVQNFNLKLQNSPDTSLTGFLNSNWNTVFTGTVVISDTGWIYFNFSNPFLYDTSKNLIVEACFSNPNPSTAVNYTWGASNSGGFKMWASTYPNSGCDITGGGGNGSRAAILLFFDLNIIISGIEEQNEIKNYYLSQNYPNPFNPISKIKFDIPSYRFPLGAYGNDKVVLKIYDILGKEVATLVNEILKPGSYEVTFDGSNLSSGVYFYKLTAGNFIDIKKMILLK